MALVGHIQEHWAKLVRELLLDFLLNDHAKIRLRNFRAPSAHRAFQLTLENCAIEAP
jgi:hypothetical protein